MNRTGFWVSLVGACSTGLLALRLVACVASLVHNVGSVELGHWWMDQGIPAVPTARSFCEGVEQATSRPSRSKSWLDLSVRLSSDSAAVWRLRGLSYVAHAAWQEGEATFEAAAQIEASDLSMSGFWQGIAAYCWRNDDDTAIATWRRVPGAASFFVHLGESHLEGEGWISAASAFQTALSIDPDLYLAHRGLGWAAFHLQDIAVAQDHLEIARDLAPHDKRTRLYLGLAYLEDKKFNEASQELQTYVAMAPSATYAWARLGQSLLYAGERPAKAAIALERALSEESHDWWHYDLARAYLQLGELDRACIEFGMVTGRESQQAAEEAQLALEQRCGDDPR
jgi:tetratricopeptide (TPR) repeat protein